MIVAESPTRSSTTALKPHGRQVVSLDRKCLGANPRCKNLQPPLPPRGIFDKETRRKTVAVAGAAMELVVGFGRMI
jgi:hypothetical protein